MTRYRTCPFCHARRMLYQLIDGIRMRICYQCFKVQAFKADLGKK